MSLLISGDLRLANTYTRPDDADAVAYIAAVEAADGQALETATRMAINSFVKGCKTDGIWPAIKASCILSGARTLAGALVPLVGTAPTNVGGLFVSGDYNRKTGLVGNGSSKYLNTNRAGNLEPQNNIHFGVYVSQANTASNIFGQLTAFNSSGVVNVTSPFSVRLRSSGADATGLSVSGFTGVTRNSESSYQARSGQIAATITRSSNGVQIANYIVFTRDAATYSDSRLAFYSIGESLNLALLDARVTDLINAFAAAIP